MAQAERFEEDYTTVLRRRFDGDVTLRGKTAIIGCDIAGDLVAEDDLPLFVGCRVWGRLIHHDLSKVTGCISHYAQARPVIFPYPPE